MREVKKVCSEKKLTDDSKCVFPDKVNDDKLKFILSLKKFFN